MTSKQRRTNFILKTAQLLAMAACMASCRTTSTTDQISTTKWGLLPTQSHHLIHLPDGEEIRVCGVYFEQIRWAIQTWSKEIQRSYDVKSSCTRPHINAYGPQDPTTKRECARWGFTDRMYMHDHLNPMPLYDCGYPYDQRPALLHEVGHLFGLCDQYPEQIHKCAISTEVVPGSVMHEASKDFLTPDDIEGIKQAARRSPIPDQPGSVIVLNLGWYRNPVTNRRWYVTPQKFGRKMTGLTIQIDRNSYRAICGSNNQCSMSSGTITPQDGRTFTYQDSAKKMHTFQAE